MKAHDAAHVIDGLLTRQIEPRYRVAVLEHVRTGYDGETGEFIERTAEQDAAIRCLDCEEKNCEACDVGHLGPF